MRNLWGRLLKKRAKLIEENHIINYLYGFVFSISSYCSNYYLLFILKIETAIASHWCFSLWLILDVRSSRKQIQKLVVC